MPQVPLFSTPLSMYDLPGMEEVNRDLTARLVAESKVVPSVQRSNVGGWHSRPDLALRPESCFRTLTENMLRRVRETVESLAQENKQPLPPMRIGIYAWAMVMRHGDYTMPHDHAEAHWGSVYYPDAGDADEKVDPFSGLISFINPRHGGRQMPVELFGTIYTAKPSSGRLLIFPGWLLHYVNAYHGTRPRVAISANFTFELAAPPRQVAPAQRSDAIVST